MKIQHRPHHWIAVAIALAVFLLTLSEVHGQSTGAAAFEGRPAVECLSALMNRAPAAEA